MQLRSKKLIVLVALAMLGASLWIYSEWTKHVAIQRKRVAFSKLQAVGVPLTASEREAFASVPAGVRDSTDEWASLFADRLVIRNRIFKKNGGDVTVLPPFVGMDREGKSIPSPRVKWDQEQNAGEYLQQYKDVMHRTHELARSQGAWRYISTKDLRDDEVHSLNVLDRNLGELLLLDAHFEARLDHSERAYEDLITVLRIVDAGQFEAEYDSVMALGRLHRLASTSAARLCVVCKWTDQQMADLQMAVSHADFKSRMKRAYMGEVSGNLKLLETSLGSFEDQYFSENLSLYAEMMLPVIQGYDNTWPTVFPTQWLFALEELQKEPNSDKRFTPLFMILPATTVMITEAAATTAVQRSAITALARQRHFLKSGTYPESLQQLAKESQPENVDLSDPFVGGPLKASMSSQGWVIYGVGTNKVDDGGDILPQQDRTYGLDAGLIHGWP